MPTKQRTQCNKMITLLEYFKKAKVNQQHFYDLVRDELSRPYHTLRVAGKSLPQNLLTSLKRVHSKCIKHINTEIRSVQTKEKVKMGYAYTSTRYGTTPLFLDLDFLVWLAEQMDATDKWDVVRDENNLPIEKKLVWRHAYRAELQKLLTMAILKADTTKERK